MHWFLSQDLVKMQSICSLDLQSPEVPVPSARYWYGQRGRQIMHLLTEIHLGSLIFQATWQMWVFFFCCCFVLNILLFFKKEHNSILL